MLTMNRRGAIARVLAGVAAVAAFALPGASPALAQGAENTITIGHYGSLTGPEATFGTSTSHGIRLAIERINAAGGVLGKQIVLKEYDTRGDQGETKLAVERLVKSDKVVAVIGEVASSLSLVGGPVCQEAGVPMVTPSSTNPKVTQVGDFVFRVCYLDPFQGYAGAKFAREDLKAKTAAVLIDQSQAYSKGLGLAFAESFEKTGGKVVTTQSYNRGAQDFTAQLTSIRTAKPDVIYIPGYYTDVGNIALQVRKLGMTQPMLGGDGWDSSQLAEIAKDAIEGSYFTNHSAPDQPDPAVQSFIKAYQAAHKSTPDSLAALGFDAANILFDAITRAKGTQGRAIRDSLAATKDFKGVTGTITIDANRDARKSAVVIEMAVPDGKDMPQPKYRKTIEPQ